MKLRLFPMRIAILDAPYGYDVTISPSLFTTYGNPEEWFEDREIAQAYARGLNWGTGWVVDDWSTPPLVDEALCAPQVFL
ncbi:hypothetical protein E2E30_08870 [Sphingomonas sp. AAP5]|uniref:hypothetical protein n=1 Tax=Sphingomonas sp. AAP5 TaxID=1523415 RepID=UPI00105711E0|nr:hypothetical protein [Sphingomonas sp. AAP5]QBM75874.1 hypothetical protein E2E30_08870 [Sphingomonas sp. AAP5]